MKRDLFYTILKRASLPDQADYLDNPAYTNKSQFLNREIYTEKNTSNLNNVSFPKESRKFSLKQYLLATEVI